MNNVTKILTAEEKDLLLKDLCARLPYGVKVQSYNYEYDVETIETLQEIDSDGYISTIECETLKCIVKPYLFPLESMTVEQEKECQQIKHSYYYDDDSFVLFDWYNKNHFDYRGLIPMSLALDATDKNIY